jgi:hypothetical protein
VNQKTLCLKQEAVKADVDRISRLLVFLCSVFVLARVIVGWWVVVETKNLYILYMRLQLDRGCRV